MTTPAGEHVWEAIYSDGRHLNRYPWDSVVTFVFQNRPSHKSRSETRILEVGCGTGNNLWFVAREGFSAAGVDISHTAIAHARGLMKADGLEADLRVGGFHPLPFADSSFDLVLDRGALTCVSPGEAAAAINEVERVLEPGGRFLFTPFSKKHGAYTSNEGRSEATINEIGEGSLAGVGAITFYSRDEAAGLLKAWRILSLREIVSRDFIGGAETRAVWEIVAEKEGAVGRST